LLSGSGAGLFEACGIQRAYPLVVPTPNLRAQSVNASSIAPDVLAYRFGQNVLGPRTLGGNASACGPTSCQWRGRRACAHTHTRTHKHTHTHTHTLTHRGCAVEVTHPAAPPRLRRGMLSMRPRGVFDGERTRFTEARRGRAARVHTTGPSGPLRKVPHWSGAGPSGPLRAV